MNCTFFGHRIVHGEIEPLLRETLMELIRSHNVSRFFVGNQGGFDMMVIRLLDELSAYYPIEFRIVLAYMPKPSDSFASAYSGKTVLPEGIESVPRRFAVDRRNRWMIERSDFVVTHVVNSIASGASKYMAIAKKRGKTVINLQVERE